MLRFPLARAARSSRAFSTRAPLFAKSPLSQGHTTDKASDLVHKDKDVQSASARAGFDSRANAQADADSGSGDAPGGYDAARQGSEGGEVRKTGAQLENRGSDAEGALKDQVGGQPEGGGVQMGHKEETAGESRPDRIKKTLQGFAGLRQQHNEGRDYHTLARPRGLHTSAVARAVSASPEASRQPKDEVAGDQNAHLSHKAAGAPDSGGKGNAAAEPTLPSKHKRAGAGTGKTDAGAQSKSNAGKSQRGLHTSARVDSVAAPGTEGKQPHEQTAPDAGAAGSPGKKSGSLEGKTGSDSEAKAATAKKLDPTLSGGKIQNESKAEYPKGKRGLHTSAARGAAKPPGGYARAHEHEAAQHGYNVPPEALPANLESDYDPRAKLSPDGLTPSSEEAYSSSARDPPNPALRERVLKSDMPEKNPQPHAGDGRKGNFEAWKDRKV
ncbi:hypothetical protein Q5752_007061 [Cryptotrichosporon argae]